MEGDITRLRVDAIVNAANSSLMGGGGHDEETLLAGCYRRSLALANEVNAQSIGFSAISNGVYGFPKDRAAHIAVATVAEGLADDSRLTKVVFCCFDQGNIDAYLIAMGL